jgi:hypothetical protein
MNCPKCNGGSFVSEEELVQVMDGEPARLLLKATFSCRACNERYTRLVWDDLGHHRKVLTTPQGQPGVPAPLQPQAQAQEQAPAYNPYQSAPSYQSPQQQEKKEEEIAEGLRFF